MGYSPWGRKESDTTEAAYRQPSSIHSFVFCFKATHKMKQCAELLMCIGCKEIKVSGDKWKASSKVYMLPKLLKLSQVFIP